MGFLHAGKAANSSRDHTRPVNMTATRVLGLRGVRREDPAGETAITPQKRLLNADIELEPAKVTRDTDKTGQVI